MKKKYFPFLWLAFMLYPVFSVRAQATTVLRANNDFVYFPFQSSTVIVIGNILENDNYGGQPIDISQVTITQLPNNDPGIFIEPDGTVWMNPGGIFFGSGVHTGAYQICSNDNPGDCDTAFVTVHFGGCLADTPILTDMIQPGCQSTGSVNVAVNPGSDITWTVDIYKEGAFFTSLGQGTGPSVIPVVGLEPGDYDFFLQTGSGCISQPAHMELSGDCLALDYSGVYEDFNADGLVNVGDVVNYTFTITNNSGVTANNITMQGHDPGFEVSDNVLPSLAANASHASAFTGKHVIKQADINAGYVQNFAGVSGTIGSDVTHTNAVTYVPLSINDGIRMNAFFDLNGNGTQETGELPFTQGTFSYVRNNGTTHHMYSATGDFYLYETDPEATFDIGFSINSNPHYTLAVSAYNAISIAEGSGLTVYNFPVTVLPHTDLAVYLDYYQNWPRPGFSYGNKILYTNNGNQTIASGTITFVKDSRIPITNISQPGTSPITDGFTYNFTNLLPNESRYIVVMMQTPLIPEVNLGDLITNTATITIPAGDSNENNNSSVLAQHIVGSFDPNDKTESHGGEILHAAFTANDYLTYTIRFENTGTAEAINIKINDILDEQLDETSLRMVESSHNYILDRVGNNLTWRFDGILLPPSVPDTATGKGCVVFQVKPKPGYAIGDIIPNSAAIYFDFNPEIVTEPCLTTFVSALKVNEFDTGDFMVYPNPVQDILQVSGNGNLKIDTITIVDISGKTMFSETVNRIHAAIDLSSLSSGIYFAKVKTGLAEKVLKIIKS